MQCNFEFQSVLEQYHYWFALPAEEERPFEHKYKAREILEKQLESISIELIIERMLIHYFLALNFMETEESGQSFS